MAQSTDIRLREIEIRLTRTDYRTPIKFGGRVVNDVVVADAFVKVENRSGKLGVGRGSMTMGNVWAWPSVALTSDETLKAMTELLLDFGSDLSCWEDWGDPLELGHSLSNEANRRAGAMKAKQSWAEAMPVLAQRVSVSPLDAAIHDAFGRLLGRSSFACLGRETINLDLATYLDDRFKGEYLDQYISPRPTRQLPLYHLVGALDPLDAEEVTNHLSDGLPVTLADWIRADGLDHLKIKLAGDHLDWDVARVLKVDQISEATWAEQQRSPGVYSLDFNERCADVSYVLEFLERIRSARPQAFERVQYIEQPTHRDLKGRGAIDMHQAARIKPVVIDESLLDLESLEDARRLGYSGIALKACKGQTDSLLMAAAARKQNLFLCVQDLTCVGASFLHSTSLAAHVPGVAAIEGNGRQYCPAGNRGWDTKFPGMFAIEQGRVQTSCLEGWGLGFEWI